MNDNIGPIVAKRNSAEKTQDFGPCCWKLDLMARQYS